MLENVGKGKSFYSAMKDAGYSDNYAKNPQRLKQTKTWGNLVEKYLPEKAIVSGLKTLLKAETNGRFTFSGAYTKDMIEEAMKTLGYKSNKYVANKVTETRYNKKGDTYEVTFWDVITRKPSIMGISKGADMALKIRGNYAPEKMETTIVPETKTKEEKENRIKELEEEKELLEQEEKKRAEELRIQYYRDAKEKKNLKNKTTANENSNK